MKKTTIYFRFFILIMLALISCKKDKTPVSTFNLKVNDTTVAINNLKVDDVHLSLPNNQFVEIQCDNFKLTFLYQSGNHIPYICQYVNKNGNIYEYQDYQYTHGIQTDPLTGTVNCTKNGDNFSGIFDLRITKYNTSNSVKLTGSFSYNK